MNRTLLLLASLVGGVFGISQMVQFFYNDGYVMAALCGVVGVVLITIAVVGLLDPHRKFTRGTK